MNRKTIFIKLDVFPLFLLTWLYLAGCATNPYTLQAAGNQALEVAHGQMTATAETAIRANEAAILIQAQTQASNDNLATSTAQSYQAMGTATALYFDIESTRAASTAQAIATQEAQTVSATRQAFALAELQTGATGTAVVVGTQTALNFDRQKAEIGRQKVVTVAGWVFLFAGIVVISALGWKVSEWAMKTQTARRSWVEGAESFGYDTGKGLTVVTPRRMFSPALQLDGSGRATMPQLTAPDLQAGTTAAALWVELERERSKKPQWFTPTGKNGNGESFAPMIEPGSSVALPMPQLTPLPMLEGRHVLIASPTGGGKTHTARYLLQARQKAIVLDPHNKPGIWPGHCEIVGGGRNFEEIGKVTREITTLMSQRFRLRARGEDHFDPIHIVTDELPAIVDNNPAVSGDLHQIGMEGRKVGIFLFLLTQSVMVRSLGLEGRGDLRENFVTVKIAPLAPGVSEATPRQCTVIVGDLHRPESEDKYIIPALPDGVPFDVPNVPILTDSSVGTAFPWPGTGENAPEKGSKEEADLIRSLASQQFKPDRIALLLGGRRVDTLERIRATLGTVSVGA